MSASLNQGPSRAKMLAVGAVCIALAFVLNQITLFRMPMGGSVTPFSMMFIVLAGYWLGPLFGVFAGAALGLLDTITGAYIVHPVQYVLDYILGFGALGLSGFFRKWKYGLQIGYIVGVAGRFLMVFLSGVIFFYMFAPEGQPVIVYSAVYNGAYILPEMIATLVIISLPAMKHAVDAVTKSIVSPADYAAMTAAGKGSAAIAARILTGTVSAIGGGIAFILANYLQRMENLTIIQLTTDAVPFLDTPRADRLYRLVERTTEQVFALQTVGVIFVAIGIALLFSTLARKEE
ncbi:MAG: energy-coupled thiamine transporter ThiT [Defluviitaleaceae bacterium]|nr:energy-coupled thiamine transporter ThiT [Defluviitaleaceae bacterium]MCL2262042.1 energy-coupled thiamine transporter ThiT [Defluviitaleaceae bacterium]